VGQASSLSIEDDGQDARPTSNLFSLYWRLPRAYALAMTGAFFCPINNCDPHIFLLVSQLL